MTTFRPRPAARKPLAIDLYCGLGGWTEGLLAEGWDVIGFDIEAHAYGEDRYPGLLVLQDVLTLHGSQFKGADLIVGSSPCQEFSYRAMPWKRAKALGPPELGIALFEAQFRIQREACEANGRHIPMVVENVRGAQKYVGLARYNFGSYYLWGDVPALMPRPARPAQKNAGGGSWFAIGPEGREGHAANPVKANDGRKVPGFRFDGSKKSFQEASVQITRAREGMKAPGADLVPRSEARRPARLTNPAEGRKGAGAGAEWFDGNLCQLSSKSTNRKAASAAIAKIPLALSSHIARVFKP